MALTATMYRYSLRIEDVDRGLYETLEVRVARHPSETDQYFVTRLFAYALAYEEGLVFSPGGLSDTDEPALSRRDATGQILTWIEIGAPAAERLHRASKRVKDLRVYTHRDPSQLVREATKLGVHRGEHVLVIALEPALVESVAKTLERNGALEIVHTAGHLYVTSRGQTFDGPVTTMPLVSAP